LKKQRKCRICGRPSGKRQMCKSCEAEVAKQLEEERKVS